MTGDTTPQQQAVALLVEKFGCDKSVIALGEIDPRTLAACKHIGGGFLDFGPVTLGEIVDCLADAGLLCSSPVVQPQQDEGRSAPEPSAAGQVVSYDELVDWVTRLEVTVKPVNGVINIVAESMADAFADFLRLNGIGVSRG